MSPDAPGGYENFGARYVTLESSGRYTLFTTMQNVPGPTPQNGWALDLQTGAMDLAGDPSYINGANVNDREADISDDGRYVVFTYGFDAYLFDMNTGVVTLNLGLQAAAAGFALDLVHIVKISDDGRVVGMSGRLQSNTGSGGGSGCYDLLSLTIDTGAVELVSADENGSVASVGASGVLNFGMSENGRYWVFDAYANGLVAADNNSQMDAFWKDQITGELSWISEPSAPGQFSAGAWKVDIDDSGDVAVFIDRYNSSLQLWSRADGSLRTVSIDSCGAETPDLEYQPVVSGNGRFVAQGSRIHDTLSGQTRVATLSDQDREVGERISSLSDDASIAAFRSGRYYQ